MNRIILTLTAIIISVCGFSQDFEVPKNYKLEKGADYAVYEQDVINCVNWLMNTSLDVETQKRKDANAFLLKWLSGSPNLHIEINPEIVTFMSTSPNLLMVFMGGWAKYSLETKDFKNKIEGNLAGIESVIDFYVKNKKILPKDKNVEKYIKMKEKGTLKKYIKNNA